MTAPPVAVVTGATGFLGSRLARILKDRGWAVRVLVRDAAKARLMGYASEEIVALDGDGWTRTVASCGPAAVFHCAAWSAMTHAPGDVRSLIETNVTFGAQLLEAVSALDPAPPVVWAASFWQFSGGPDYAPNSLYAASKQAFGALAEYYRRMRGCRVAGLVLFDVYGENDPRGRILTRIAAACRARARGESPAPIALSPGLQEVDFVHADDVALAFVEAAGALAAGRLDRPLYGVPGGERGRLRDVVEALLPRGCEGLVQWGALAPRAGEVMTCPAILALPGWQARTRLRDGFGKLLSDG